MSKPTSMIDHSQPNDELVDDRLYALVQEDAMRRTGNTTNFEELVASVVLVLRKHPELAREHFEGERDARVADAYSRGTR